MEPENEKPSTSVLGKKVGTIDKKSNKLAPSQVTIVGVSEKTEKPDGTKFKLPLVQILCKHPDREDPIAISKITLIDDKKVITKTTWADVDKDGNIQKGSAIDDVLKFFGCDCLSDIEGKEIHTVVESKDSSFLCLKLFS